MATKKTVTGSELETMTGLSERRLRQLADAGHIPQPTKGSWSHPDTIKAVVTHYRTRKADSPLNAARLKKLETETELLAVQLAEEQGRLVPVEELAERMQAYLRNVRDAALNCEVIPEETRREILGELATMLRDALCVKPDTEPQACQSAAGQT